MSRFSSNRSDLVVNALLITSMLIFSGCSGLVGQAEDGGTPTETISATEGAVHTPTERKISDQKDEVTWSGNKFLGYVEDSLSRNPHTYTVASEAFSNNTVRIAVQKDREASLNQSIMDVVQSVGEVVFYSTSNKESPPRRDNGSLRLLYQPESISVYVHGPDGNPIGIFDIDPGKVREYRKHNLNTPNFAEDIVETLGENIEFEEGSRAASYYLNKSELTVWVNDYKQEVREWTEEAGGVGGPFPIEDIGVNESRHEVLHEMVWDRGDYDQYYGSAAAAAMTAYWRTTNKSFAMPPERLNLYIHLPDNEDNDYVSHMDRDIVYGFLATERNTTARRAYLDHEEYRFVNKTENPFEGF